MNTTAINSKTTNAYVCRFCGVSYDDVAEMHTCGICGNTVASGWLVKQSNDYLKQVYPEHEYPTPGWQQIYRAA